MVNKLGRRKKTPNSRGHVPKWGGGFLKEEKYA